MEDRQRHWQSVHETRHPQQLSWYQVRPEASLRLIDATGVGQDDPVIDVGGGAANLVDHLIERRFSNLTVLDISAAALAAARQRLGERAAAVRWQVADIARANPAGPYRLWHDRAVFHFLVDPADRRHYVAAMAGALPAGGHAIIATFAEDGPERCSNLPVRRYSPEGLAAELGAGFVLMESLREVHVTPARGEQKFVYCWFRRL